MSAEESIRAADDDPVPSEEDLNNLVRYEANERPGEVAFTGRAQLDGVLQLYWYDHYDGIDNARNPVLGIRFLLDEQQADNLPEIPCETYDRTPSILQFHTGRNPDTGYLDFTGEAELASQLLETVEEIPENFTRYQEGHIEQPGTLTFEGLSSIIECDAPYTFVEFESFEPMAMTEETRAFTEQLQVYVQSTHRGCGSSDPWKESYILAEGQAIYAEPNEQAEVVAVPSMPVVFKVRTVDDEWIEVYSHADSEVRGFVRFDELEPVT